MKKNHWFKYASAAVMTVVVAGLLAFAFPAASVSAAPLAQDGPPPQAENPGQGVQSRKATLERLYQRELRLLDHVNADLGRIGRIADRVNTLIDKLQERGIDTTALEAALNTFVTRANSAAAPRDQAAAILAEHDGFNPNGKVTKVEDAIETVRSAGTLLRDAHRTFHEALRMLKKSIRDLVGQYLPKKPQAQPGAEIP